MNQETRAGLIIAAELVRLGLQAITESTTVAGITPETLSRLRATTRSTVADAVDHSDAGAR